VSIRLDRAGRLLSLILGIVALACVVLLLVQDAEPRLFPSGSHEFLAAFSLTAIAFAYLVFQLAYRPALMELAKAILLAAAFLFWAANEFWPNLPEAPLFNDIAIGLFVLDVFLVIKGWPPASKDVFFSERGGDNTARFEKGCCCGGHCRWDADGVMEEMSVGG